MARRRLLFATCLFLPCLLVASCGGGEELPAADDYEDASVGSGGDPVERRPIDRAATGSVRGVVAFDGEPPVMKPLATGSEPACRRARPMYQEHALVKKGRVANAFVYVRKGLAKWELPAAPEEDVVLDQKACIYTPHAVTVQIGQTLRVLNTDRTTHNVKVEARRNQKSNTTHPPRAGDLKYDFDKREHPVQIGCNLHPWMSAVVYVHDHPFFALTDEEGAFEIVGLPAGEYELAVAHEYFKVTEGNWKADVKVQTGETTEVTFTLK
ncbi:MAG: carboxypeptidase regulatory-like domain-containing protein [Planctomycetota bacterium]|nr:carboxypeptidase regulatory-like domain-containing protein [Planctomycetota bacterium]